MSVSFGRIVINLCLGVDVAQVYYYAPYYIRYDHIDFI